MTPTSETRRAPSILLIGSVLLAAYYVIVFRPLCHYAKSLDGPLTAVWDRLAATNAMGTTSAGVKPTNYAARLQALEQMATNLALAERLLQTRIELGEEVQSRMRATFQLIDFQNERLRFTAKLGSLANERKTAILPAATNGLPEYSAEAYDTPWLWPRLHMASELWWLAVHCQATTLVSMTQLPAQGQLWPGDGEESLVELPMRVELAGPAEGVAKFLIALPLRGEELKSQGLQALTNKPAMFIDQMLIRKGAPERPGEAQLEVTVVGFVASTNSVSEAIRPVN